MFEAPYCLDSGADRSFISQQCLEQLLAQTSAKARNCGTQQQYVFRDGTTRETRQVLTVDIELCTPQGPLAALHAVDLFALPGMAGELLVGQSELNRLNLPDLDAALAALAVKRNDDTRGTPSVEGSDMVDDIFETFS